MDLQIDRVHGDAFTTADTSKVVVCAHLSDLVAGSVKETAYVLQRSGDAHTSESQHQVRRDAATVDFKDALFNHGDTFYLLRSLDKVQESLKQLASLLVRDRPGC